MYLTENYGSFCETLCDFKNAVYNAYFDNDSIHKYCFHSKSVKRPKTKGYVVIEGDATRTLRAARVIKVYYTITRNALFVLRVAGMGYTTVKSRNLFFYDSKEDFLADKTSSIWDEGSDEINVIEFVKAFYGTSIFEDDSHTEFMVTKWGWKDNAAVATKADFAIAYDVATDMADIVDFVDTKVYPYKTKEDAIDSNGIAVCEFDDEEDGGKKKEIWVEVLTDYQYQSNLSEEEIKDKIRSVFGGKNYRAWIDGDLAIEDC